MALFHELARKDPPLFVGADAAYPYSQKLADKYKFTSRFGDEVLLYNVSDDGKLIYLPRALCPIGANDNRDYGTKVEFKPNIVPRAHQVKTFAKAEQLIKDEISGIISAYTGFGKTVLGYLMAATAGVKTLVITTKEDIFDQWVEGACGRKSPTNPKGHNFLGLEEHEVGIIRGNKCEVVGTKFVVAMVQSLSKDDKYPDWISEGFGLVIFDECHRMAAEQFSFVVNMFAAAIRIGLSATPNRVDGKELLFMAHIGKIVLKVEAELMIPKVLRFKTGWVCPRVPSEDAKGQKTYIRLPHEPGRMTAIEKAIAADETRNKYIADILADVLKKGRRPVVFSTLHEHIKAIHRYAIKDFGISGKDLGFYVGATSKAEKAHREREKVKQGLLTTYTMMGEGTSIDWLDTAIFAMPRANVTQPAGRVRREFENKDFPVVIDILDFDSPILVGYLQSRLKWYNSIGATVKDLW